MGNLNEQAGNDDQDFFKGMRQNLGVKKCKSKRVQLNVEQLSTRLLHGCSFNHTRRSQMASGAHCVTFAAAQKWHSHLPHSVCSRRNIHKKHYIYSSVSRKVKQWYIRRQFTKQDRKPHAHLYKNIPLENIYKKETSERCIVSVCERGKEYKILTKMTQALRAGKCDHKEKCHHPNAEQDVIKVIAVANTPSQFIAQ